MCEANRGRLMGALWLGRLRGSACVCACVLVLMCLFVFPLCVLFSAVRVETEHVDDGRAGHREVEIIRHHLHRTAARDACTTRNHNYGDTAAESSV